MKEMKDEARLRFFLREHQIEHVLNEQLIPHLSLYRFNAGELICSQGDTFDHLFILVQGKIKIYTTSAEGKVLILSFKTPLEVIGDIEYVRGVSIINTVEAVSSVYMIGVHHRYLNKYGRDHAPLLHFLLDIITQKFYMKSNALSFNLLYPVEVRFASYLLSVSPAGDNSLIREQPSSSSSSLKDMAKLIGTSYRHLNRVIQKFCAAGLIERSKGSIHIHDREGLRRLAGHNIYE